MQPDVHIEVEAACLAAYAMGESGRNVTCFRCGEEGHRKSECHHWKTKLCRDAECKLPRSCCFFAHSASELRQPWVFRCMRIVKRGGCLYRVGCLQTGHTFSRCPNPELYQEQKIR